jgi:hypothetical protein
MLLAISFHADFTLWVGGFDERREEKIERSDSSRVESPNIN